MKGQWLERTDRRAVLQSLTQHLSENLYPSENWRQAAKAKTPADKDLDEDRPPTLGTPAYMPPEQALGEINRLDHRADVFSLGAILCEVLTGRPPYQGVDRIAVLRQARRVEQRDALQLLDACAADAEMIGLAKRCLSAEPSGRPRDAGEVARAVEVYLAGVEERARQAELERAAAQARAEEATAREEAERKQVEAERHRADEAERRASAERRARRLTLGLAVSALLLVVVGGSGAWMWQKQRAEEAARQYETDKETHQALDRARTLQAEGWPENDTVKLTAAVAEADTAAKVAHSGGATAELRQEADELREQAQAKVEAARKNAALLAALLNVTVPRETRQYVRGESGTMMALAEPSVEEQFREAFRRWDANLDLDRTPLERLVARLGGQPKAVVQEVVAGLDTWMLDRRGKGPTAGWQRLFRLAEKLDRDNASRELRQLVVSGELEREAAVSALARRLLPWSALVGGPPGKQTQRLRELAAAARPRGPVLGLVALARALEGVGDAKEAERLLRSAVTAQPDHEMLLDALGKLLERQGPAHRAEAIACYRAARAVRPLLGIALGKALLDEGRAVEAEGVFVDLRDRQPSNPEMSFHLGNAVREQKRDGEREAAYRKAIALKPDYAEAHYNRLFPVREPHRQGTGAELP